MQQSNSAKNEMSKDFSGDLRGPNLFNINDQNPFQSEMKIHEIGSVESSKLHHIHDDNRTDHGQGDKTIQDLSPDTSLRTQEVNKDNQSLLLNASPKIKEK